MIKNAVKVFHKITGIYFTVFHTDSSLNPINSENINDILEKNKHHPSVHESS